MSCPSPSVGQIDFVGWLVRLITWDGVMPVCVIAAPFIIESVLPNRRGAIEIAAVALPIVGFLVRILVGASHIRGNCCGQWLRRIQFCMLWFAVFVLVFVDALLILAHVMPRGALVANRGDRIVLTTMAAIYLFAMAVAMYPGRAKPLPEVFRPEIE